MQRFFLLIAPKEKQAWVKDYLLQVGLEASIHHPTTPIQATTGEMFQTIQNEDSIKLHLNVFIELSWSSGCSETEFLHMSLSESTMMLLQRPSFIQQIHEYEILLLLPWLVWYTMWLLEALLFIKDLSRQWDFISSLYNLKVINCCYCCKTFLTTLLQDGIERAEHAFFTPL